MKYRVVFWSLVFCLGVSVLQAQPTLRPEKINIVRDDFGVPHIFAPTDPEVAYGLAWAHAEDDFYTIQKAFLAGKHMLGRELGKEGAKVDYVVQLIGARQLVEQRYDSLSPAFKELLEGYCAGFNAYCQAHFDKLLVRKILPLTPKDMLTYSVLQLFISCKGDKALQQIIGGEVPLLSHYQLGGSNGFAFNSHKTKDSTTYLGINSHQPLEGPVSWYEAQLCSEQGWNILGALFPGSPVVLHGCNEHLGWAHTVNYPDKMDVYELQMNPENALQYRYDGQWKTLEVEKVPLTVKMLGIPIRLHKKVYRSIYGPVVKGPQGYFALRTPALTTIKALEEWYRMNKAQNFHQFYQALQLNAIPGYNIIYADAQDTIFYLSNARMPIRNPKYHWKGPLPGNTSETRWTQFYPTKALPQVLQPASGYIFNNNNTPFDCTGPADNLDSTAYPKAMGYRYDETSRSMRFRELISQYDRIDYNDFKRIKYDQQLPKDPQFPINANALFSLSATKYPQLASTIETLKSWNRQAGINSEGATIFAVCYYEIARRLKAEWKGKKKMTEQDAVAMLTYAQDYLQQYFGSISVPLGKYQKLVRGDKVFPLSGLPDVIAAMESVPYKDGMVKGHQGESYIELVRFTKNGPQIESINCYGASNMPDSPHYADQMTLYITQQTKPMTLRKEEVIKQAQKIYHPIADEFTR